MKWEEKRIEEKVESLHKWIILIVIGLIMQGIAGLLRLFLNGYTISP